MVMTENEDSAATIACLCSMLHRRRRSGPTNTSTLAIASSLALVQTLVFAPIPTNPINSQIARRSSADGYEESGFEPSVLRERVYAFRDRPCSLLAVGRAPAI